ncbi:MAG: sigma-70 family RNA polymerase sigma factor [Parabacteroides sp.]|nr:sigma-70 family RNA polymerase sigma factor [Parabacteroides sp.]
MSEELLTSAFTKLHKKFQRIALKLLPSESDAEDALQEAFCRLWPKAGELKTLQEVEAMTVTTVRNLCIDTLRREERVKMVELDVERDARMTKPIDEEIERQEQFQAVEVIIEKELSDLQKQILRMKEYEDESIESIAEKLDMQPATVRVNLSRARKQVRMCYLKQKER